MLSSRYVRFTAGLLRPLPLTRPFRNVKYQPISRFVVNRGLHSSRSRSLSDDDPNTTATFTDKGIEKSMIIAFNCNICSTRNHKTMSRRAYTEGLVLIKCDGCKNLHLIADHLGWFNEKRERQDIESILHAKGESIRKFHIGRGKDDAIEMKDASLKKDFPRKESAAQFLSARGLLEVLPEDTMKWTQDQATKPDKK